MIIIILIVTLHIKVYVVNSKYTRSQLATIMIISTFSMWGESAKFMWCIATYKISYSNSDLYLI